MARETPRVSEAERHWQDLRKQHDIALNTRENERAMVRRFAAFVNDIQVGHVTPNHVRRFFYDAKAGIKDNHRMRLVTGEPMRPGSFNKARLHLLNFFAHCQVEGWVRRTDLMMYVRKAQDVTQADRLRLDQQQLLSLIDQADDPRDKAVIAHAMNTAGRASEITWPRIKHVDLESGWLNVYLQKTREADDMAITPHLAVYLRAWLLVYERACGPLQPEWYLFPARVPMTANEYQPTRPLRRAHEVIHRALTAAGFEEIRGQGIHTIRRSVARLAFDSWSSNGSYDSALRMVQTLLHHKQITTTEIYLGLTPDKHRRNAAMRAGFIFPAPAAATPLRVVSLD